MSVVEVAESSGTRREIFPSQLGARNEELRNEVMDTQGAIQVLHSDLLARVQDMKHQWVSACEHHMNTTNKYSSEMALPPGAVKTSQDELTERCQLNLTTDFITKYGPVKHPIPSPLPLLQSQFENLQSHGLKLAEKMDFTDKVGKVLNSLMPLNQFEFKETLLEMNDLHHCDPLSLLKKEFTRLFGELAAAEAQLAQAQEEREVALRSEDIATAEDRGALILALFDQMLEIVQTRNDQAEEHEEQVKDFHSNVDHFLKEKVQIEPAQHEVKILQEDTSKDIETIEIAMAKTEEDKAKRDETYEIESRDFRKSMATNTAEQTKIWEEITHLMASLPPLLDARAELVQAQMERVEKHQYARAQHISFISTCNERLQQCKDILSNAQAAKDLLDTGADYVRRAVQGIQAKDIDSALHGMQKEEKVRYYEVYRRYILYAGELLQRKEQRLENNKRMIRSSNFQIEHAVESLDPDLPTYKQQLKMFQDKELELQRAITDIRKSLGEHEAEWVPIEQALEELEVTIEPPQLLLQELQRDLTEKHAQAVDDLTTAEQRALDVEKNQVRKLHNACNAAKTTIEERRATRQAAIVGKN